MKRFVKKEFLLWLVSAFAVTVSNLLVPKPNLLTLFAALVGVTSLVLAAKGDPLSQILMVLFSLLYGVISFKFCYWGEMITYLGMTLPMAVWSTVAWIKNPAEEGKREVKIRTLSRRGWLAVSTLTAVTTLIFYFVLKAFSTPNLFFSTVSVATSFIAAALTLLRSPFYALGYAANDVVLIILWVLASVENPAYIPVAVNFAIFLINDFYGFLCWRRRERQGFGC